MSEMIATVVFYLFAALTVVSALRVISSHNPVHSVLFLILAFFSSAGLFVLLGAEYLAMTLVIVYVGAVAVLFLFVVMMLDINFTALREGFMRYLPLGAGVALVLFAELAIVFYLSLSGHAPMAAASQPIPDSSETGNIQAIGNVLYTYYLYPFQMAGIILLVAMIGAITLTLRHKPDARRQNITAQVHRSREDSMEIVSVKSGEGVSL